MKKTNKKDTVNLFFSAFLVIAYIICAHFFTQFASTLSTTASLIISICVYVVFGLLVFYATRVGDGKAVKRFSLVTLIIMVLPSLYIIIASVAPGLPLYESFASADGTLNVIVTLACVALGYGVPYSFLSGFETDTEEETADSESTLVEGGIEADIAETEAEVSEDEADEEISSDEDAETAESDSADSEVEKAEESAQADDEGTADEESAE